MKSFYEWKEVIVDDLSMPRKKQASLKTSFENVWDEFSALAKQLHRRDWESQLRVVLRRIGYDQYLFSLGPPSTDDPFNKIVTTYPSGWLKKYKHENFIQIDPIVKHCRHHFVPLLWGSARRHAKGRSNEFWKAREGYGLLRGISIPLRRNEMVGSLNVAQCMNFTDELDDDPNAPLGKLFMLVPFLLEGSQKHLGKV